MRRAWLWIPALGTLVLFVAVGAHVVRRAASPPGALAPSAAPAGGESALHVEPAAPEDGIGFVGPEGDRDDGWPRRSVDRTALLALLRAGRVRELTEQIESLQATFEADPRKERWINEAMLGFRQADAALDAPIDAWIAAEPASFAPLLARCAHLDAVAWERRGTRTAADTPQEQMAAMHEAMARAAADCERALELRPRLVVARQRLITMARAQSDDATAERHVALALASCPTCFRIRYVDLTFRTPRWGGSTEALQASAEEAIRAHPEAPYLGALAGIAAWDECRSTSDLDQALARCDAAVATGDEPTFHLQRARVHARRRDADAALADLERALDLDPQDVDVLTMHAQAIAPSRPEQAIDEYLTAARLDPLDRDVIDGVTWARERARSGAIGAASRADTSAVERALATAQALGVASGELEVWRGELAGISPLATELAASPDSLEVHRRMDAALLQLGASEQVVAMWDRYLARHPGDGAAWLERGGTHFVRRELPAAARDARRACELGVTEGCARAQQLGGR